MRRNLKSELGGIIMRVPANTATIAHPGALAGRSIPAGRRRQGNADDPQARLSQSVS